MNAPATNLPALDALDWHFKTITSKGGKTYELLCAPPNEGFWKLYKDYKTELERAGIKPNRFKTEWTVNWWKNTEGGFTIPVCEDIKNLPCLDLEPLTNEDKLKPFQIPLVQQVVAGIKNECSTNLNGCGTGVGKTYITLAAARELGIKLLVICPKSITYDWKRVAAFMGVNLVGAHGWEWIKTGKTEFGSWTGQGRREFNWHLPDRTYIVFDEAHRAAGMKTQNAKLVISARNQAIPMFILSATLANDPTKMNATGYALGLHKGGDSFLDWMRRNGVKQIEIPIPGRGKRRSDDDEEERGWTPKIKIWKFVGGARDLQKIHSTIFPRRGVRVTADQLGDAFPPTQILAKSYEMDESKKIQNVYEMMKDKIDEISSNEKDKRVRQANILAEIMKARVEVELLKVPLVCSLTNDAIEEGNSVFLAVNFKGTLRALEDELKIKALIEGGQTDLARRNAIDDFQANDVNKIAGIIQACREGINLHDLIGGHPRISFIMPTPSAQDLKQVLGRVHRVGGKTPSLQRIIYAANTIEEKVAENLATKLDEIDLIMDGHLSEGIFPDEYSKMRGEQNE